MPREVAYHVFVYSLKYLRKYYFPFCGQQLKRIKIVKRFYPGDPGYSVGIGNAFFGIPVTPADVKIVHDYGFKCESCDKTFDDKQVCETRKIQKKYKKKILTEEDIEQYRLKEKEKHRPKIGG